MERVKLGKSSLEVSRLCLGTWNMDGSQDWGPRTDQESIELIHKVLDTGCNFIDSAHGYGGGHSEEVVGKALEGGRRKEVILATKIVQGDPSEIEPSLDAALKRLRTDYLDLYIVHWPRPSMSLDDFLSEMVAMRDKGKTREIGVSNFDLAQMQTAARYGVVSLQPPFNVLWRIIDKDVLPFCRDNNIAVTPYSPLAQGLLTGRFTRKGEQPDAKVRKSNFLFKEPVFSATSSQVALAWVLQTDGITSPIVGVSRFSQWEDNMKALEIRLSDEQYSRISEAGMRVWAHFTDDDTMWGWKPK